MTDEILNGRRRARVTVEVEFDCDYAFDEDCPDWHPAFRVAGKQALDALAQRGGQNALITGIVPVLFEGQTLSLGVTPPLRPCPYCRSVLWVGNCCKQASSDTLRNPGQENRHEE